MLRAGLQLTNAYQDIKKMIYGPAGVSPQTGSNPHPDLIGYSYIKFEKKDDLFSVQSIILDHPNSVKYRNPLTCLV